MVLRDWALPAVVLKAVMDVDTGIFRKIPVYGSRGDRYNLFFPGVVRQLKAKVQGGISAAGRVGGGMRDARQEIGAHGGVAAQPGGTGNIFGSADLQPAPRALTWIDCPHVNSTWTSCSRKGLGTGS